VDRNSAVGRKVRRQWRLFVQTANHGLLSRRVTLIAALQTVALAPYDVSQFGPPDVGQRLGHMPPGATFLSSQLHFTTLVALSLGFEF
jgi:hypothetical protein